MIMIFSFLLSIPFMFVAYLFYADAKDFVDNSYKSLGLVVQIKQAEFSEDNGDKYTLEASVIAYKMHNGKINIFLSDYKYSARYDLKETVIIRYSKNDYEDVRIETFMNIWGGVVVFGFFASFCLLMGLYLLIGKPKLEHRDLRYEDHDDI